MSSAAIEVGHANRWLLGPRIDLLLGCGIAYYLIFVALSVAGPEFRAIYPLGLLPVVALALSVPHYGATLLRVYERTEDQQRYRFFAVFLTALIGALFVTGVYNSLVASLLITVYLTWSPWHYSGQNYGIGVMFLRRNGVDLPARSKRFLYWSFMLSFSLPIVEIHGVSGSSSLVDFSTMSRSVQFVPIGIGPGLQKFLFATLGSAYLLCSGAAIWGLLRRAPLGVVAPTLVLMFTQSLWFVIPTMTQHFGLLQDFDSLSLSHAEYAFFWIAIAHAVQYLWITTYFARKQGREQRASRFYFKALVAGAAIWAAPGFLFGPGLLGNLPFDAGLAALVAAVVNIHHFMLDGAIWKLRDGRIARVLFRNVSGTGGGEAVAASPARRWILRMLAGVGVGGVLLIYVATTEYHLGFRRSFENNDLERAQTAYTRLSLLGRDSGMLQGRLGLIEARRGRFEEAIHSGQQAVQLERSATTLTDLAAIYEMAGRLFPAASTLLEAVALEPEDRQLRQRFLNLVQSTLANNTARREHVAELLDDFIDACPAADPTSLAHVARFYQSAGYRDRAIDISRLAIERADPNVDPALLRELEANLQRMSDGVP